MSNTTPKPSSPKKTGPKFQLNDTFWKWVLISLGALAIIFALFMMYLFVNSHETEGSSAPVATAEPDEHSEHHNAADDNEILDNESQEPGLLSDGKYKNDSFTANSPTTTKVEGDNKLVASGGHNFTVTFDGMRVAHSESMSECTLKDRTDLCVAAKASYNGKNFLIVVLNDGADTGFFRGIAKEKEISVKGSPKAYNGLLSVGIDAHPSQVIALSTPDRAGVLIASDHEAGLTEADMDEVAQHVSVK